MADGDVKFTVVADVAKAKSDLEDVEKAAERVQDAVGRGAGGGAECLFCLLTGFQRFFHQPERMRRFR